MTDPTRFQSVTIDGHHYWADPATGRVYPQVTGGADGDGDSGGDDGDNGGEQRTFTQADVDRARTEARRTAATDVAEQLGCTVDEARQVLDAVRAADEAQQTEAQRREAAAATAEQAARDREAAAAARERAADLRDRLRDAGVPRDHLDRAVRSLDVTADSTDDEITAEVTAAAELFTPPAGNGTPPPPGAPPAAKPPATNGTGKTAVDAGAERYRTLHPAPA